MSGERREHHLHDAASLDPFPQKIAKCSDHVDQICRKEDQEAVQKLHSKQLLSFNRGDSCKVNLLLECRYRNPVSPRIIAAAATKTHRNAFSNPRTSPTRRRIFVCFRASAPISAYPVPFTSQFSYSFPMLADPHGRRHRHCKEECEQGKSDRPESSFHVLFHKFKNKLFDVISCHLRFTG